MQLTNSLTRRKEPLIPIRPGEVSLYTCGPTVHDFAHVGNFRTFIFEDLLRRALIFKGFRVRHVMNITDVDDKTIRKANAEGVPLGEFTARYKRAFFEDLDALRIQRAEHYPEATDHIAGMVALIERLLERGHAYRSAEGSIYFRLESWPGYGQLVALDRGSSRQTARVDQDEYGKDDPQDFALWKAWEPSDGPVFWDTALGRGRPGWHIECSAMSRALLGDHFDIHTGGVDNKFPHHENEIAQSVCATGAAFVNVWMHSAHLQVEGFKMSKSLGNFLTLRDLVQEGLDPVAIRYALLTVHYRKPLNFTREWVAASAQAVGRLRDFARRLDEALEGVDGGGGGEPGGELGGALEVARGGFVAGLEDDLNIAASLSALFTFVRQANAILDGGGAGRAEIEAARGWLGEVDGVLDVLEGREGPGEGIVEEVEALVGAREAARAARDWSRADALRAQIEGMGFEVRDGAQGPRWIKVRGSGSGPDR